MSVRADDLAGERAEALADLRAEHRAADLAHHAEQRAGHRRCISSGTRRRHGARPTRSATGSTSACHAGRVASTHSARLQATRRVPPEGSAVASSSQRSASRTASSTARALAAPTASGRRPRPRPSGGRCRLARSQFTGPPSYESSWPSRCERGAQVGRACRRTCRERVRRHRRRPAGSCTPVVVVARGGPNPKGRSLTVHLGQDGGRHGRTRSHGSGLPGTQTGQHHHHGSRGGAAWPASGSGSLWAQPARPVVAVPAPGRHRPCARGPARRSAGRRRGGRDRRPARRPAGVRWRLADVCDPALVERDRRRRRRSCTRSSPDSRRPDRGRSPPRRAQRWQRRRGRRTVLTAAAAARRCRGWCWSPARWCTARPPTTRCRSDEDAALAGRRRRAGRSPRCWRWRRSRERRPAAHPGLRVTVLRPAVLVGPGADSAVDPPLRGAAAAGRAGLGAALAVLPRRRPRSALELAAIGVPRGRGQRRQRGLARPRTSRAGQRHAPDRAARRGSRSGRRSGCTGSA